MIKKIINKVNISFVTIKENCKSNSIDYNQIIRNSFSSAKNSVSWHLEQHGDHGDHGVQVVLLLSLSLEQRGAVQQQLQFLKTTAVEIIKQMVKQHFGTKSMRHFLSVVSAVIPIRQNALQI